jgi:hypothetical protein
MAKYIYRVYCVVLGSPGREIRIPAHSASEAERLAREVYGACTAMAMGTDGVYTGFRSWDDAEGRGGTP